MTVAEMENQNETLGIPENLPEQPSIKDRGLCLEVHFSKPGASRKVKIRKNKTSKVKEAPLAELVYDRSAIQFTTAVEVEGADPVEVVAAPLLVNGVSDAITVDPRVNIKRVSVTKKIIDAKEYKAIGRFDRSVKAFLNSIAVPTLYRPGVWMIPHSLVPKAHKFLTNAVEERKVLVAELKAKWNEITESARLELGPLFIAAELADIEGLEALFDMTFSYLSFDVPASLKSINEEVWEQEQEKAALNVMEMEAGIQMALRMEVQEVVDYAVEKLTDNEDGRPRAFTDKGVTKMRDFLATFTERNTLTGDNELAVLAEKARALIAGVDPSSLKADTDIRQKLSAGFSEVKKELDNLIEIAPVRRFNFGRLGQGLPAVDAE